MRQRNAGPYEGGYQNPGPQLDTGYQSYPRSPAEMLEPARAPQPPHRRRERRRTAPALGSALRFLNGLFTLALMLMLIAGGAFFYVRHLFDKPGPLDHSTVIVIPKGDGVNAIAQRLEREGIISDSRVFVASVLWFRASSKLKAGEYEIRRQASMRQVLDTLIEGKAILYKISIPEGLTSWQVVQLLNADPNLVGDIPEIPPEGTLLPDTYKFSRNTERQELIERMQSELKNFLTRQWQTRQPDLPFQSPLEALILASIVEKETGIAAERDRIAGVFVNRMRKKMRLQSDPTIIYGITLGKGPLGRPIKRSEIDRKTPYNTYQIDGLPPTPICNPGRAAIEAVMAPAATRDLYFVADGTGGHAFAESIRDHQKNVAKWRVIYKELRAKQQAAAAAETASATAATTASSAETSAGPGVALDDELDGVEVTDGADAGATTAAEAGETALADAAGTGEGVPVPIRNPGKTQ